MSELLLTLAGAFATLAAAYSLGLTLCPSRGLPAPAVFGLGTAVLSCTVFLCMTLGWASRPVLLVVLALSSLPLALHLRRLRLPALPPLWFLLSLAPFAVLYVVHGLAPEVEADPNIYHLLPAFEAFRSGGFGTGISFHNRLPHGLEMLFVPAYAIGGSASAKLVHFAFLAATPPLMASVAQSLGIPRVRGWLAGALYFITPVVGVSGTSAFNDAGAAFFALLTFYLLAASAPLPLTGIASGFAYAVKMTGAVPLAAASIWVLCKANVQHKWFYFAGATLMAAPWLVRNWIETGNPFAPFLNAWFLNDFFPEDMDRFIRSNLSAYGGVRLIETPVELTFLGRRLQGLLGPVYVLLPLALLSVRLRAGRYLLLAAAVLTLPWFFNLGARFLMPSLPFWLLALIAAIPLRLAGPTLCLHAILSWPAVLTWYAPDAWCLRGFPWQAALRIQSERQYLEVRSWDYRMAQTLHASVPAGARIFDLYGAQGLFLNRPLTGFWQSAQGRRIFGALVRAFDGLALYQTEAPTGLSWSGLRIRPSAVAGGEWCVHEVTVAGRPGLNVLSSLPAPEAALAFDANPLSAGCTWRPASSGDFLEAAPDHAPVTATVRVFAQAPVRIESRDAQGFWSPAGVRSERLPPINLRSFAGRLLASEGFGYIIVPVSDTAMGRIGESMANNASDWGLELIANHDHVYLFKVLGEPVKVLR